MITLCASAGNGPTDSISAAPSATPTTFTIFASPRFSRPAEPRPTGADPADRGRTCALLVAGAPALVRLDGQQAVVAALLLPADEVVLRRVEVGGRVAVGLDRHARDGDRVLAGVDPVQRAAVLAGQGRRGPGDREPERREQRRDSGSTHQPASSSLFYDQWAQPNDI